MQYRLFFAGEKDKKTQTVTNFHPCVIKTHPYIVNLYVTILSSISSGNVSHTKTVHGRSVLLIPKPWEKCSSHTETMGEVFVLVYTVVGPCYYVR